METVARMKDQFQCGPDCGICTAMVKFGDCEDYDNDDRYADAEEDQRCVDLDCRCNQVGDVA